MALNLVETLVYDKAGNVIQKTDAPGNVTTSAYDRENRLVRSPTDALGQAVNYGPTTWSATAPW